MKKIAIIWGGDSSEYEVSRKSGMGIYSFFNITTPITPIMTTTTKSFLSPKGDYKIVRNEQYQ